jgi:hypothetical protein
MQTSILHEVGIAFDDRAALLQVALGAISLLHRFREILNRYGQAAAGADPAQPEDDVSDDDVMYLVLGLISVSQHLMPFAELARTEARGSATRGRCRSEDVAHPPRLRDLLECPS